MLIVNQTRSSSRKSYIEKNAKLIRHVSALDIPDDSVVKNLPPNAGEAGLTPGLGRFPGGGNGNPL